MRSPRCHERNCGSIQPHLSVTIAFASQPSTLWRALQCSQSGRVDSQEGQQVADPISQGHDPPAARSARFAGKDARCFSANTRTRSMWGYPAAILRPLADWHGAPLVAPHFGHTTALKLGFTTIPVPSCRNRRGGKVPPRTSKPTAFLVILLSCLV